MGDAEPQIQRNIMPNKTSLENHVSEPDMREILKDKTMFNFAEEYLTGDSNDGYFDSLIADLENPAKKRSAYEALRHVLKLATVFAREFLDRKYEDKELRESLLRSITNTITSPLMTKIQHAIANHERKNFYGM